jgi:rare lipoprotein A
VRWLALALAVSLAGCGLLSKREAPPRTPSPGGYYQDDGPGGAPPVDLDVLPDAVPRLEPLNRFANRPYEVFGREYVPLTALAPYHQRGIASWYGRKFHGERTSSGETYDMYAMSAAHPTLPIPSYARVTAVASGRSVVVRINDRGPFHAGRAIDLSYAAAHRLGLVGAGSALVDIDAVVPGAAAPATAKAAAPATATATATAKASAPATATAAAPGGVYLQLGAFAALDSAESFRARVARELAWLAQALHIVAGDALYRLRVGPFGSAEEARPIAERIRRELNVAPFLVVR